MNDKSSCSRAPNKLKKICSSLYKSVFAVRPAEGAAVVVSIQQVIDPCGEGVKTREEG